ncbi:MAG: hypothetical protein ACR2JV_09515 [Gaiellales bacterium]
MDILFAVSQGAGLAVACGLAAVLPLGVLAVAAILGWTPGALAFADTAAFAAVAWIAGIVEAAARAVLPIPIRIALSAVGAAAAFEIAAGDRLPFVGLVVGALIGAGTAWTTTRMADRAIAGGGTRWGVTGIVAVAAIVVAAVAIIPIAGFVLVAIAIWFGVRSRRDDQSRYQGLRVLR